MFAAQPRPAKIRRTICKCGLERQNRRIRHLRIMLSIAFIIALYSSIFNVKILACSWLNFIFDIPSFPYLFGIISFVAYIYPFVLSFLPLVKVSPFPFYTHFCKNIVMIFSNIKFAYISLFRRSYHTVRTTLFSSQCKKSRSSSRLLLFVISIVHKTYYLFSLISKAVFTNPLNNGWAFVGRDLNSGWN